MIKPKAQIADNTDIQIAGQKLVESALLFALRQVCREAITANCITVTTTGLVNGTVESQENNESLERTASTLVEQVLINACDIYLNQLDLPALINLSGSSQYPQK